MFSGLYTEEQRKDHLQRVQEGKVEKCSGCGEFMYDEKYPGIRKSCCDFFRRVWAGEN